MINLFKVRRWAALLLTGFLSVICFYIGAVYYGFLIGLGTMAGGLILGVVLGNLLLKNPFTQMVEGSGILVLNMDSTGVIVPYIVGLDSPYIRGKIGKKPVNDVWDRETVQQIAIPELNKIKAKPNDRGGITIDIDEKDYNEARFRLFHYPVLIWNDQVKSLLTKDFFSNMEKETFSEHGILFLNRKMEELNSAVRDFGRHVVELTKPIKSIFQSKWTWIIVFIAIVILVIMFAPSIIQTYQTTGGAVSSGVSSASSVMPR